MLGKEDGTFRPGTAVTVAAGTAAVNVVGDVNRDGKLDIVVAAFILPQYVVTRVFLLQGNGDGTFKPPIDLAIPGANHVALADLNGDGNLDLTIAAGSSVGSRSTGAVAVYLGRGDGSFDNHVTLPIADYPQSDIMVADFNGDRKPDLAVNTSSGVLSLLISKGGGDFQPASNMPVGRTGASAEILVADFNADGIPDLAVNRGSGVNILLGKGDGTFLPPITLSIPPYVTGLTVADFDGDGILDLFNGSAVLLGKGDGTFGTRTFPAFGGAFPRATVVGDFNHDGKPDFANAYSIFDGPPTGGVAVLLGRDPFYINSVVNAASLLPGNIARGEIITISGRNLGPRELKTQQLTTDGLVDTSLAGVRVLFNGRPAPLLSVGSDQINAVVLYSAGSAPTLTVEYNGERTGFPLVTALAAPGLFTVDGSGKGQGAILNEDGTQNSESNPAKRGSVITFFATGEGLTTPDGVDGKLATEPVPVPLQPVIVGINDGGAEVLSAGGSPGLVAGIMRVVARIPSDAPSGNTKISIGIGGFYSQPGVTVAIE
jgi:uncharacterized protein (TIGR03437 family)